jgi:hypothetical protein
MEWILRAKISLFLTLARVGGKITMPIFYLYLLIIATAIASAAISERLLEGEKGLMPL